MTTRHYLLGPPSIFEARSPSRLAPKRAPRRWLLLTVLTSVILLWLVFRWIAQPAWMARLPQTLTDALDVIDLAAALTLSFVWLGLALRRRWQANSSPVAPLTLEQIYSLTPSGFEHYVAGLFRQKGYQVRVRGRSGDHGVDLVVRNGNGKRAIVQCKRYQNTVGEELVRELFGTLIHERAAHAFLVATAEISGSAYEWAQGKPITLIDGRTLVRIAAALGPSSQSR